MDYFDNISDLEKTFSSRILQKSDVLFREGDTLGDAYIIKYGEISIEKNNITFQTCESGEVLGVFNIFFNNKSRLFTAIAKTNSEVFVIPEKFLKDLMDKADPFVKHCFRSWLPLIKRFTSDSSENINKKNFSKIDKEKEFNDKMKMV
jgi:CRP-like cAMP-binding protein